KSNIGSWQDRSEVTDVSGRFRRQVLDAPVNHRPPRGDHPDQPGQGRANVKRAAEELTRVARPSVADCGETGGRVPLGYGGALEIKVRDDLLQPAIDLFVELGGRGAHKRERHLDHQ